MQLEYLETLVEAAACGSFSKAAETLCITQSAVSKRIKFLEEHYGYALLDRSGSQVTPTPAGEIVIEKARKLIEIERDLKKGLEGLSPRDAIAFCCTPAFGIAHLPAVMRRLMLHEPDMSQVRFHFDTPPAILEGLAEQRFDVAVAEHCTPPDLAGLRTFALPPDEMVFVSAPQLRVPAPRTSLEVLFEQTLLYRRETCCSRIFLDANLRDLCHSVGDFRSTVMIDDLHLILEGAQSGRGIAFVSQSVVEAELRSGALVAHRVDGFVHRRDRTLVASPCCSASRTAESLIRSVLDVLGSPSAAPAAAARESGRSLAVAPAGRSPRHTAAKT